MMPVEAGHHSRHTVLLTPIRLPVRRARLGDIRPAQAICAGYQYLHVAASIAAEGQPGPIRGEAGVAMVAALAPGYGRTLRAVRRHLGNVVLCLRAGGGVNDLLAVG